MRQRLHALRVPSEAYSLGGGHPDEAYVLDQRGDHWLTYYSERGQQTGARTFDSESEACTHLLQQITHELNPQDTNTNNSPETRH